MKTRMTILLLPLWIGCAGPVAAQEAQSPKPSFAISINAPRTSVKAGTRVPLIVMATNISDHDISLGASGIYGLPKVVVRSVSIIVYDSSGKRVPETQYGRLIYGLQIGGGPGI